MGLELSYEDYKEIDEYSNEKIKWFASMGLQKYRFFK